MPPTQAKPGGETVGTGQGSIFQPIISVLLTIIAGTAVWGTQKIDTLASSLAQVKEDVAVMKVSTKDTSDLRSQVAAMQTQQALNRAEVVSLRQQLDQRTQPK